VTPCKGSWVAGCKCVIQCDGWTFFSEHSLQNRGVTDETASR